MQICEDTCDSLFCVYVCMFIGLGFFGFFNVFGCLMIIVTSVRAYFLSPLFISQILPEGSSHESIFSLCLLIQTDIAVFSYDVVFIIALLTMN